MRGGILIKFEDYPILQGHLSTLQEISIDDHEKDNVQYMTDSQRMAVNFDKVKEEYISNLSLVEVPKSNDALFLSRDNKLIFVEFKNGFMDGKKKFDVRKKIYDSIIILTDILDVGISHLRDQMEYVLVYNESVNQNEKEVLEKNLIYNRQKHMIDLQKVFWEWRRKNTFVLGSIFLRITVLRMYIHLQRGSLKHTLKRIK